MVNEYGQSLGVSVEGWSARKFPDLSEIIGKYCTLKPLDLPHHADLLFNNLQNKDDWTYLPFGPFNEFDQFYKWLEVDSQHKQFYVILGEDHPSIGLASFHDVDVFHGVIEVGSVIFSKNLQRTRSATEAMFLMMKYVFDDLGYRRYQWRCNSLNVSSKVAAERLGFTFEGVFRSAHVFKGHNRDTAWFSILDSEWPDMKSRFMVWLDENNFDSQGDQIKSLNHC